MANVIITMYVSVLCRHGESKDPDNFLDRSEFQSNSRNARGWSGWERPSLHELSILVSRAENRSHCQLVRSKINKYYVLGRLEKSCITVIKLNTFVTQNKKGTV